MGPKISRRLLISGLLGATATAALGNAPLTSAAPLPRPDHWPPPRRPRARPDVTDIVTAAELGGMTGLVVADARTGEVLERSFASTLLPPASVAKAVTGLYALEVLGPDHRFRTTVMTSGTVTDGVLDGTLVLCGGGDPTLDTNHLAQMAKSLSELGLKQVTGGFEVWDGALPYIPEIDPAQLDHLDYNPAISGLNLNFNRVYFQWQKTGADYRVSLDARSDLYQPEVHTARMAIMQRDLPVYTYVADGEIDSWTVAKTALGNSGSRWLPVRHPALYAADVFRTFAAGYGISLPAATRRTEPPSGTVLATYESDVLSEILRDCLKYSTNLTAEVLGLSASAHLAGGPEATPQSAERMNRWIGERTGARVGLVDHSGLGEASRIAPRQMVSMLSAPGAMERLRPLLKDIPAMDDQGNRINAGYSVKAKTGTLNFVSTLAGYITTETGRDLAFAIFSANMERRDAVRGSQDERPVGAASWNGRAKRMQRQILRRWGSF